MSETKEELEVLPWPPDEWLQAHALDMLQTNLAKMLAVLAYHADTAEHQDTDGHRAKVFAYQVLTRLIADKAWTEWITWARDKASDTVERMEAASTPAEAVEIAQEAMEDIAASSPAPDAFDFSDLDSFTQNSSTDPEDLDDPIDLSAL
jgi:hypothetical protein